MTKITRIEIALNEDGTIRGAQASLDNGRVIGVNTGKNPEYGTLLADVLGEALSAALGRVAVATQEIGTLQASLDAAVSAGQELQATIEQQQATITDLQAKLDAPAAEPPVSASQLQAGFLALGFTEDQIAAFAAAVSKP